MRNLRCIRRGKDKPDDVYHGGESGDTSSDLSEETRSLAFIRNARAFETEPSTDSRVGDPVVEFLCPMSHFRSKGGSEEQQVRVVSSRLYRALGAYQYSVGLL